MLRIIAVTFHRERYIQNKINDTSRNTMLGARKQFDRFQEDPDIDINIDDRGSYKSCIQTKFQ